MKLSAKQLGRRYERAGRPFWALRHADLSVGAGDFVTVLGRSGSGKTTLLTLLLGLCMPTEGEVAFNGRALSGMSDEQISALRNAHIGYVPRSMQDLCRHSPFWTTFVCRGIWPIVGGLNPQAALKSSLLPWVLLIWADSILERFPAESFVERRLPERS